MNITSNIARRQAEICVTLVKETDRSVVEGRRSADQVLAGFYRRHREYGARDRRFFSNAVFSWFRWRGWLKTPTNENIAAAILLDAPEIPPPIEYFGLNSSTADLKPAGRLTLEEKVEYLRHQLRFSSLQIDECRGRACPSTPLRALSLSKGACPSACNPPVADSTAGRSSERSPTIRLRSEATAGQGGDPTILKFPSIELAPDWLSGHLYFPPGIEPEAHLRRCLESFQTRPPTWLRLRSDQKNEMIHSLTQMGIETGTHPLIEQAVFIKGLKKCDLAQLPGAEAQDLASQCVGICCNPKPGEQWWDVCAGAGGKSLHLADLMQDNGLILATDIRTSILDQLSKRVNRNKYRSIRMAAWNGIADLPAVLCTALQAGPAPDKYFDGVLVDAPCCGMGTWARNPDARWRIFPEQIRNYADVQSKLLQIAATKVKPGGRLVYATCTLTTLENTDVIRHFLERQNEFYLENILNPLNREQSNGLIWIWPWEWNCNGMFIAVMKKSCASTILP